jgi:hypothetical protein
MIDKNNSIYKNNTWNNNERVRLVSDCMVKICEYLMPTEFQHYSESKCEDRVGHIYEDLEIVYEYATKPSTEITRPFTHPLQMELF